MPKFKIRKLNSKKIIEFGKVENAKETMQKQDALQKEIEKDEN